MSSRDFSLSGTELGHGSFVAGGREWKDQLFMGLKTAGFFNGIYTISSQCAQAFGLRLEPHHWLSPASTLLTVDMGISQPLLFCEPFLIINLFILTHTPYWFRFSGEPQLLLFPNLKLVKQ